MARKFTLLFPVFSIDGFSLVFAGLAGCRQPASPGLLPDTYRPQRWTDYVHRQRQ